MESDWCIGWNVPSLWREIEGSGASKWPRFSQPTKSFCVWILTFSFCSMKAHVKGRAMFYQEIIPPLFVNITPQPLKGHLHLLFIVYQSWKRVVSTLSIAGHQETAGISWYCVGLCPAWHVCWIASAQGIRYFKCLPCLAPALTASLSCCQSPFHKMLPRALALVSPCL